MTAALQQRTTAPCTSVHPQHPTDEKQTISGPRLVTRCNIGEKVPEAQQRRVVGGAHGLACEGLAGAHGSGRRRLDRTDRLTKSCAAGVGANLNGPFLDDRLQTWLRSYCTLQLQLQLQLPHHLHHAPSLAHLILSAPT
jgi:hypothetical protein